MSKTPLTKLILRAITKISRCLVDTTIRREKARDFFWFYFSSIFLWKKPGEIPDSPPGLLTASLSNDDGDGNGNDKKGNGFRLAKQQFFTTLFCTFLSRRCTTTTWKCRISLSEHRTTTFFSFSWTLIESFRIQLQKKLPTYDKLNKME